MSENPSPEALAARIAELERERDELTRRVGQLSAIIDGVPDLCFLLDEKNRYLDYRAPPNIAPLVSPKEFLGKTVEEVLPGRIGQMATEACNRVREIGRIEQIFYPLQRLEGVRYYSTSISRVYNRHLICVARDITPLKQTEERLRNIARRLGIHVQHTPLGFIEWNTEFVVTQWNPAAEKIFGYSRSEAMGKHPAEIILPEDVLEHVDEIWNALIQQKGGERSVNENLTKDGRTILCEWHNTLLIDDEGEVMGAASFVQDITERKTAEHSLEVSERRYRELFEQAPMGIILTDKKTRVVDANPLAGQFLGYPPEQITGMLSHDFIHPDDLPIHPTLHPELEALHKLPATFECRYKRADGSYIPVEVNVASLAGNFALISFYDISERKKADIERTEMMERLRQAQKMEALGTLAGGIAHDFNNLLMAILGYSDMALETLDEEHRAHDYIEQVLNAGMRARDTVQQILAFSRREDNEHHPLQMHLIVKETLKLLRASIPSTIEIEQEITCEDDLVLADPNHIQQVLMNLCTNAYQAMRQKGGVLRVTMSPTRRMIGSNEEIDCLKLTVSDTGMGMEPMMMQRIFEPYFTTKRVGEGSGLGLSAAHGIVTGCGGEITVESELGQGTAFHVYLPRHHQLKQEPTITSEELPTGNERILVVDDEELVGSVVARMLGGLGYRVSLVLNPTEALERFRNDPDAFDLLISDETMPVLTGEALAQRFAEIRPGFPVILYSGENDFLERPMGAMTSVTNLMKKPLTRQQLAENVRQTLDKG